MRYSADAGSEAPEPLVMSGGGEVARRNADSSAKCKGPYLGPFCSEPGSRVNKRPRVTPPPQIGSIA
jgi:hypothetical protein